jgi:hypothetical protein
MIRFKKAPGYPLHIILHGFPANSGNAELPVFMVVTSVCPGYACNAGAAVQSPGGPEDSGGMPVNSITTPGIL